MMQAMHCNVKSKYELDYNMELGMCDGFQFTQKKKYEWEKDGLIGRVIEVKSYFNKNQEVNFTLVQKVVGKFVAVYPLSLKLYPQQPEVIYVISKK